MKGGPVVDRGELIKWADALDAFAWKFGVVTVQQGLERARKCRHPDAQWLAALFPGDTLVTPQRMLEVMLQQDDDPRALFFS
jgi:hypothetical protein